MRVGAEEAVAGRPCDLRCSRLTPTLWPANSGEKASAVLQNGRTQRGIICGDRCQRVIWRRFLLSVRTASLGVDWLRRNTLLAPAET